MKTAPTPKLPRRPFEDIAQRPQRQDGLNAQLHDLQAVAVRLGMYDAADLLSSLLKKPQ